MWHPPRHIANKESPVSEETPNIPDSTSAPQAKPKAAPRSKAKPATDPQAPQGPA
jgi:hypothetical protein